MTEPEQTAQQEIPKKTTRKPKSRKVNCALAILEANVDRDNNQTTIKWEIKGDDVPSKFIIEYATVNTPSNFIFRGEKDSGSYSFTDQHKETHQLGHWYRVTAVFDDDVISDRKFSTISLDGGIWAHWNLGDGEGSYAIKDTSNQVIGVKVAESDEDGCKHGRQLNFMCENYNKKKLYFWDGEVCNVSGTQYQGIKVELRDTGTSECERLNESLKAE